MNLTVICMTDMTVTVTVVRHWHRTPGLEMRSSRCRPRLVSAPTSELLQTSARHLDLVPPSSSSTIPGG